MNYSSAFAIAEKFALAYKIHYVFFLLPSSYTHMDFPLLSSFLFSRLFFSCKVLCRPRTIGKGLNALLVELQTAEITLVF